MTSSITVNGRVHSGDVDDDTPLLWVLRDTLGLTGTKFGCGMALCGACTVHLDGQPVRSCSIPVSAGYRASHDHRGDRGREARAVQAAWVERDVPQCGYCQSGQVMAALALLRINPNRRTGHRPGDDQHMPLRHLPSYPRGDPRSCRKLQGS